MISIKKKFWQIPERLCSDKCLEKLRLCLAEKNTHSFSTYYYRDGCITLLKHLYHDKCAYCETKISAGATLRVDHYRPKARLQDDNEHLGYYWLGYEWSNLILICETCNRYKSNHFPISNDGLRVYRPVLDEENKLLIQNHIILSDHFIGEKALLLNPEIDDVENHFIINSQGLWMFLTQKGETTEKICGLNRSLLILDRKSKIDKLVFKIKRELDKLFEKKIDKHHFKENLKSLFEDLERKTTSKNIYSRTYWFMFYKFEQVILPHFEGQISRITVMNAFKEFLIGNL